MRAECRDGSGWDFAERFDEDCAFGSQIVDDVLVVDDFVSDINGRAVAFERALDGIDRADDRPRKINGAGQE